MAGAMLASPSASAQPEVTGVAGTAAQGATLTIEGSGFGIKDPAPPLVWDDGSSNPPLDTHYDAWLPTDAQQGDEYNMAYRSVPFRGVDAPYDRIEYVLAGAHATDTNQGSYAIGGNVGVGANINSHEYFVSYYYRMDPLFDDHNNPTMGENLKEFVLWRRGRGLGRRWRRLRVPHSGSQTFVARALCWVYSRFNSARC